MFGFMANVAYLNRVINALEQNYSMLIHTSGKKADHSVDYKQIVRIFEALKDEHNPNHEAYFKKIWEIANQRYPGHADDLTKYVLDNRDRNNIVVMNSDKEVNAADNLTATDPTAPFTVVIGVQYRLAWRHIQKPTIDVLYPRRQTQTPAGHLYSACQDVRIAR